MPHSAIRAAAWVLLAVLLAAAQTAPPATPPAAQQPAPAPAPPPQPSVQTGVMNLQNASLTEVIDILCRQLQINYILDPRVKGGVTLNTYGQARSLDARNLLELILRINGATMAQVGEIYRIVPLSDAPRLPIPPVVNPTKIQEDDQVMLNMIFLRYASVSEVSKLLEPFVGEGAMMRTYVPANLLLILDSRRNMRRTMELIAMFDSDVLSNQRVRLFEVRNGRPEDIAKELETVLKSISVAKEGAPVKLVPIDRINTIIAVAANPGVFDDIEEWIKKLDTEIKVTAGSIDNYVYRVKYSRAEILAGSIMQLYGGFGYGMGGFGMGGYMGMAGMSGMGPYSGMSGMSGYGGMGGYGMGGYGMGGYGMGGYGMAGMMPFTGQSGWPGFTGVPQQPLLGQPGSTGGGGTAGAGGSAGAADQTGTYLGAGYGPYARIPRVVPNPIDNTLLIQASPQEYQQILKLLKELDIPPRQVLIDARIFEVSLTGAFASGVSAFLRNLNNNSNSAARRFTGSLEDGTVALSLGALVGQSRELLAFLTLAENQTRAKVISAPSVIATDSLPASINVGVEVPTLTASTVSPIQSGGSNLFANTIQNRSTGVTLGVTARVSPGGVVTLLINQQVSAPIAPEAGSIQSPSFSNRTISTQVTVMDGDTIAIGGIINETDSSASAGIPVLHRLPVVGSLFGSRSYAKERTELVVFMTPRVIYDTNQIQDASEELKSRFRRVTRIMKD